MNRFGFIKRPACENKPNESLTSKCYSVSMAIMETLFDVLSASIGAIFGALFAFFLNRKRNSKMIGQLGVSRQALDKIKLENHYLLEQIKEKENLILKMQMQILGTDAKPPQKTKKTKK